LAVAAGAEAQNILDPMALSGVSGCPTSISGDDGICETYVTSHNNKFVLFPAPAYRAEADRRDGMTRKAERHG
jgi:hypothetical protein